MKSEDITSPSITRRKNVKQTNRMKTYCPQLVDTSQNSLATKKISNKNSNLQPNVFKCLKHTLKM